MDREQQLEVVNNSWPPLSASQAAKVLREIPDFREERIASLCPSARPMAAACLVTTASGKQVFLKRYHQNLVSSAELEAKHSFVNQLANKGFPTPRFFCFNQGDSTRPPESGLSRPPPALPGKTATATCALGYLQKPGKKPWNWAELPPDSVSLAKKFSLLNWSLAPIKTG